MKSTLALVAVAGLASVAAAQSGSLSITSSDAIVDTTGAAATFTLSVWGDADFGTHIGGGGFALSATGGAGIVTSMGASVPAWGALGFQDNGATGDGNYAGVIFGQLIFPPIIAPDADSALGNGAVLLATFSVTAAADSSGTINWSTADAGGDFVLEIFDEGDSSFTRLTSVDFGGVSVEVVPAPSAMALLGLGGLVAGRRRR